MAPISAALLLDLFVRTKLQDCILKKAVQSINALSHSLRLMQWMDESFIVFNYGSSEMRGQK